ncbi:hypothetical protein WMY93_021043 [Mugilogobius chulae]|uniref:Saposin B-type domain-containing protein n=1 Tax=Mugilogobius chulae TaxID=88201 RepID=A0AAW0N9K6_9GOBI
MAAPALALLLLISLQSFDPIVADGLESGSTEVGDVCKDCTGIFELLDDMFSSRDFQVSPQRVPDVFSSRDFQVSPQRVPDVFTSRDFQVSPQRSCQKYCKSMLKLLLLRPMTKKITDDLEGLCELLPGPKTAVKLCKQEVEKLIPVAIHFITGVTKPAEVCKLLGLCHSFDKDKMLSYFVNEALEAAVTSPDDPQKNLCSFCLFLMRTLEGLLPRQRTEDAVIHALEDVCHVLPKLYQPQCEDVVGKLSKTVIDAILSYATPRSICQLLQLCRSQDDLLLDPCTVESYRCRDFSSALRCGTLFYCQKFAWKSMNTI